MTLVGNSDDIYYDQAFFSPFLSSMDSKMNLKVVVAEGCENCPLSLWTWSMNQVLRC